MILHGKLEKYAIRKGQITFATVCCYGNTPFAMRLGENTALVTTESTDSASDLTTFLK